MGIYHDSKQLSDAVSKANMPKELGEEIQSRLTRYMKEEFKGQSSPTENQLIGAMRAATDDQGILTLKSLQSELDRIGIKQPSADYLVGQAEVEGELLRTENNSWSWLQQSS
jgi:hypothetical protein